MKPLMPEVIFNGPAGRIEGRYQPAKEPTRRLPSCCILTRIRRDMNNQIIYHRSTCSRNAALPLRFNSRGVGRSQGLFDHGLGELSDAASALDWLQTINPEATGAGSPASPSAPGSACSC